MIVGMWMTHSVVTIEPATPIHEAAVLMSRHGFRRLPVVRRDAQGPTLLGLVSATDLYAAFPRDVNPLTPNANLPQMSATAESIMARDLHTVTVDTPIDEAAALMRNHKIGGLPVVRSGTLVGLITESDIFHAFVTLFQPDENGVRVTFDNPNHDDVFALLTKISANRKVRIMSFISSHKDGQDLCVLRMLGEDADTVLEELWKSGRNVLSILRW